MPISAENFKFIQDLAKNSAAIILEPGKEYLVESRLTAMAQQTGFANADEFIRKFRSDPVGTPFHDQIIDALTTNETSFFRDLYPFETLKHHVLPRIIEKRAQMRRITIWSAASSTGQEAYSMAMIIREHFPELAEWNVSILGTDLSPTVVEYARKGLYSQLEVSRGMPAQFLVKYFSKMDGKWAVKDELKRLVEFKQFNLIKPWPSMPLFDIIFIRNVMIYFEVQTKKDILNQIGKYLQPHGCLFLGTAETTINIDPQWKPITQGKATYFQTATAQSLLSAAA